MGNLWLPHLAKWLRDGNQEVVEYPDWLTRSRSSGGYDNIFALQHHHDASAIGRSGLAAAHSHWRDHINKPVGALNLDRNGVWWVGAAGATNTSGVGGPLVCSRGTIPTDAANRYVISTEAANNGIGEYWNQIDEYIAGTAAIVKGLANDGAYNAATRQFQQITLDPSHRGDIHGHKDWTSRKIDPAGPPHPYSPTNDPYKRWDMGAFRANVVKQLTSEDIMQPRPGDPRALDTRQGGERLNPTNEVAVYIGKYHQATINLTAINTTGAGFLTAWTRGEFRPVVSNVNWWASGITIANSALVFPNDQGYITVAAGAGECDLVVDVQGVG